MIADLDIREQRLLGSGLLVLAVSLLGWAGASLWFATEHMARLGAICGDASIHCGWCVSAVGGAAAAVMTAWLGARLLAGLAPAPRLAR